MRDEINRQKVIEGCKKGDRLAQKELFEYFSDKMFGVCLSYSRDRTAGEDILHEGFIKIFENINQFKGTGSLEGWMRRIMVNTALERFRRQKKMYAVGDLTPYEEDLSTETILETINVKEIMEVVQELTPQYRMVFMLYAVEGYSHKEICRQMKISEGTSKSNLSRARVILQEKLKIRFGKDIHNIKKIRI